MANDFFNVRFDASQVAKGLDALIAKQLPFAKAQALTAIAKNVQRAEKRGMESILDHPTPFTLGAVGVVPARKDTMEAKVFLRDRAAEYLEPYEFGGRQKLNSKALLVPKEAKVNKYGNLPRQALNRLKSRPDVFIGKVKTKNGLVSGVWQRNLSVARAKALGKGGRKLSRANTGDSMKLLIRFGDAQSVSRHLGWFRRADRIIRTSNSKAFDDALRKALETAR